MLKGKTYWYAVKTTHPCVCCVHSSLTGFWIDNDVFLYNNIYPLLVSGYQFVPRWVNIHVIKVDKRSALARRVLQLAVRMPYNHPQFQQEVMSKICAPAKYAPVSGLAG